MIVKGFVLFHLVLFVISTVSMMFHSEEEGHENTLLKEAIPFYKEHYIKYYNNSDWFSALVLSIDILLRYTALALHEIWHFVIASLIGVITVPLYFSGHLSYRAYSLGISYHGRVSDDKTMLFTEGRNYTKIWNREQCPWIDKLVSCAPFLFWAFFTILFFIQAFANLDILSGLLAGYLILTWKLGYITLSESDIKRTWDFFANFYFSNPNHFNKNAE